MSSPGLDHNLGFVERVEDLPVEQFVTPGSAGTAAPTQKQAPAHRLARFFLEQFFLPALPQCNTVFPAQIEGHQGAGLTDTDRNLARRSRGAKTGLVAAICIVVSLGGWHGVLDRPDQ